MVIEGIEATTTTGQSKTESLQTGASGRSVRLCGKGFGYALACYWIAFALRSSCTSQMISWVVRRNSFARRTSVIWTLTNRA
ncbi:hypothetical protein BH23CHL1_BH23CHL1_24170 [soil metagenome]